MDAEDRRQPAALAPLRRLAASTLRSIGAMLQRLLIRPAAQRIDLVAYRPLHHGGMLYVADFDGRRHVFVAAPNAACPLASYPILRDERRDE